MEKMIVNKYYQKKTRILFNLSDIVFRYDGSILFHVIAPSRPQYGQLTSDPSIIRTFLWTLLAFSKPNYDNCHNDDGTFSLFLKCEPEKLSPGWSIFAKAELTLLHATDPNKNFVKSKCIRSFCFVIYSCSILVKKSIICLMHVPLIGVFINLSH
jgi:hypothetical protein